MLEMIAFLVRRSVQPPFPPTIMLSQCFMFSIDPFLFLRQIQHLNICIFLAACIFFYYNQFLWWPCISFFLDLFTVLMINFFSYLLYLLEQCYPQSLLHSRLDTISISGPRHLPFKLLNRLNKSSGFISFLFFIYKIVLKTACEKNAGSKSSIPIVAVEGRTKLICNNYFQ